MALDRAMRACAAVGGRHEDYPVKAAHFGGRSGAAQVPEVNRVEAPAEAQTPGAAITGY